MPHLYRGELRFEVPEPENESTEPLFKGCVEFPIKCPKCASGNKNLKKNGHDGQKTGKQQKFYCKRCKTYFYPHTSWVFVVLTKLVLEQVLLSIIGENLSLKAIATQYSLSKSFLSILFHQYKSFVQFSLDKAKKKQREGNKEQILQKLTNHTVWFDETFFKLNRQSWCLILFINSQNEILGWKLSRTRTKADYLPVLRSIKDYLPEQPVFVGDGYRAIEGAIRELQLTCYLIQHVHSHPWNDAKIHYFQVDKNKGKIAQSSILIDYDAFLWTIPKKGYAYKHEYTIEDLTKSKKKRGRPKGAKTKRIRSNQQSLPGENNLDSSKKRGPKNIRTRGKPFLFHPQKGATGWELQWIKSGQRTNSKHVPTRKMIDNLLLVTYNTMEGGYIVSHRIESKNRQVKDFIPNRGLKTPDHVHTYLDYYLTFRSSPLLVNPVPKPKKIPTTTKIGFLNMFKQVQLSSSKIEVKTM